MPSKLDDLCYAKIASELRTAIESRHIGPGEALLPERELARKYSVSVGTIRRGIGQLVAEGKLEKRHGLGTFVLEKPEPELPVIALLVPQLQLSYYARMAELVEKYCTGELFLITNPDDLPISRRIAAAAGRRRFDAILIAHEISFEEYEKCRKLFSKSEFLFLDATAGNVAVNKTCSDNIEGGRIATAHLIAQGRRRIVYLGNSRFANGRHRALGCRLEMEDHQLPFVEIDSDVHFNSACEAMRRALSAGVRPDGVFAVTDMAAMGCVTALKEAALRVPEDVAVIGYSNLLEGSSFVPALSSIDADLDGMVRHALGELFFRLHHPNTEVTQAKFQPRLIVRASSESL